MIAITISVCIVISLMILLMFLVLKRTVKMVNESSKKYFVNTIKEYDQIIDKKQEKLIQEKELTEVKPNQIKKEKEYINKDETYINLKIPSYIDETFFENYRKINETFNIDKEKTIQDFINKYVKEDEYTENKKYEDLKRKLNFEETYKMIGMDETEKNKYIEQNFNEQEKDIIKEFKQKYKKFNISKLKTYLDEQIDRTSPIIYVKVGSKYENYDRINPNIRTIYDDKVYTGMIIIYKSKIYDYSLGWR